MSTGNRAWGQKVKQLRQGAKFDRPTLAKKIGATSTVVRNFEEGYRSISGTVYSNLCGVLKGVALLNGAPIKIEKSIARPLPAKKIISALNLSKASKRQVAKALDPHTAVAIGLLDPPKKVTRSKVYSAADKQAMRSPFFTAVYDMAIDLQDALIEAVANKLRETSLDEIAGA